VAVCTRVTSPRLGAENVEHRLRNEGYAVGEADTGRLLLRQAGLERGGLNGSGATRLDCAGAKRPAVEADARPPTPGGQAPG